MCVVALAWSGPALQVDVVAVCSAIPLKLDLKQAFPGTGPTCLASSAHCWSVSKAIHRNEGPGYLPRLFSHLPSNKN